MKPAWITPEGACADLLADISGKVGALQASGAHFLAFPVRDIRLAAEWALACFHSSVTFVPLPPDLPPAVLELRLAQLPGNVTFYETLPKSHGAKPQLRDLNEIWAVIFSSGTSGEPKGVALTGASLKASALAHAEHSGARQAAWLLDLPLFHIGGLSVLTRALFLDTPLALASSRFSAAETARWIRAGRVQGLSLVPTTARRLLQEPELDFSALSLVLLGGAPSTPELLAETSKRALPVRLTYGMTEHASQIATERASGSGLEALPGVEISILDGEILVRSQALAKGYFRNGRLEGLPLRDGYFPTGDLGVLEKGKLILRGRRSELIISGGLKVYPAEIEAALLLALDGIEDCAILGLPHSEWGEEVCAAIVQKSRALFLPDQAKESLKSLLESHKIPKKWVMVPAIPRSPSGKVLRPELLRLVASLVS